MNTKQTYRKNTNEGLLKTAPKYGYANISSYLGGLIMKDSKVEFISTPEGRALPKASLWTNPDSSLVNPAGDSSKYVYEYSLKDHLGNLRVACRCADPVRDTTTSVILANSPREPVKAVQTEDYDAWGLAFGSRSLSVAETNLSKYKYNGKELVEDLGIGLYEYGFRWYDAQTAKFVQVDPLADKTMEIYGYVSNNPINLIDPDGREGIVISGQHGGTHVNNLHFLENGLNRAEKALDKRQSKSEKVTWIIYNDGSKANGFTKTEIKEYQKKASKLGIKVIEVKTTKAIIEYVNNKNGGETRLNDKITSLYYVGHAIPGTLNPGYPSAKGALDPIKFESDSFSSGCWINVVAGCRTDVDKSLIWDDSVVDKLQKKVDKKSTINGSNVRTDYQGGVNTDEQLLKTNKGKIITVKGENEEVNN